MLSSRARLGLITTISTFVAALWLFLAPFIIEYQPVGEEWIDATINDLWAGGIMMAVSALTFLMFLAFALRDAANRARRKSARYEAQH